jgi:fluoride exporter
VTWLLIGLGGAVGAPLRYLVDGAISKRTSGRVLPFGTVVINVLGSAALGAIVKLTQERGAVYALAATGFCGAFTTFSTFAWETLALAEDEYERAAIANVAVSVVVGLGAAALAYGLA